MGWGKMVEVDRDVGIIEVDRDVGMVGVGIGMSGWLGLV